MAFQSDAFQSDAFQTEVPSVAIIVFETDASNPPETVTAQVQGTNSTVLLTVIVKAGHYYRLRATAGSGTIVKWIEYSF